MTELESQLLTAFTGLSKQYERDMSCLEQQNKHSQQQISSLSVQISNLSKQLEQQSYMAEQINATFAKVLNGLNEKLDNLAEL